MADPTNVIQIITTVGFPIAMCLMLCWYIYTNNKSHREEMDKINQLRSEETEKFTEALNNNTLALQRLSDKMEVK